MSDVEKIVLAVCGATTAMPLIGQPISWDALESTDKAFEAAFADIAAPIERLKPR